ncbi:MAG: hypothetical protein ABIH47_10010, partial [Candidatus Omnitrophota bacterium]
CSNEASVGTCYEMPHDSTNFGHVIEHAEHWRHIFGYITHYLEGNIPLRDKPVTAGGSRNMKTSFSSDVRGEIPALPKRPGKTGEAVLIERIQKIFARYDRKKEKNIIIKEIFLAMLDVDTMDLFGQRNEALRFLLKRCEKGIEPLIERMYENIDTALLDEVRAEMSHGAHYLMQEPLNAADAMTSPFKGRFMDSPILGNALFFMNYIDKEIVLRITPQGKVLLPSRIDPPYEMSEEEIDRYGFRPLVNFIQEVRFGKDLLEDAFKNTLVPIYDQIELSDGDRLIKALREDADIDIVLGEAALGQGLCISHTRQGLRTGRAPGVWVGDLLRHDLQNRGREGSELMAQLWIDEIQHIFIDEVPHGFTGRKVFGEGIIHNQEMSKRLDQIIKDIYQEARRRKEKRELYRVQNGQGTDIMQRIPRDFPSHLLQELFRSSGASDNEVDRKIGHALRGYQEKAATSLEAFKRVPLKPVLIVADTYREWEFKEMERVAAIENVMTYRAADYVKRYQEDEDFVFYIGAREGDVPLDILPEVQIYLGESEKSVSRIAGIFHFKIVFLALLAKSIPPRGTKRPIIVDIQSIFPRVYSLAEGLKNMLIDIVHTIDGRIFTTAA